MSANKIKTKRRLAMNWGLARRNRNSDTGLDLFRRDMSRVFDDFFSLTPSSLFKNEWMPSIDVEEDDDAIHVKAEIPGIDEKDIDVSLENNVLTIKGEKREERKEEDKKKNFIFSERKFGSFSRSITLPDGIKGDEVKAVFKKGVLKIDLPRDEERKPRKIDINAN